MTNKSEDFETAIQNLNQQYFENEKPYEHLPLSGGHNHQQLKRKLGQEDEYMTIPENIHRMSLNQSQNLNQKLTTFNLRSFRNSFKGEENKQTNNNFQISKKDSFETSERFEKSERDEINNFQENPNRMEVSPNKDYIDANQAKIQENQNQENQLQNMSQNRNGSCNFDDFRCLISKVKECNNLNELDDTLNKICYSHDSKIIYF
jgi:hypothetical protein